jgi:hypothetical protein
MRRDLLARAPVLSAPDLVHPLLSPFREVKSPGFSQIETPDRFDPTGEFDCRLATATVWIEAN